MKVIIFIFFYIILQVNFLQAQNWEGKFYHGDCTLKLKQINQTEISFSFLCILETSNVGTAEGVAKINGKSAVYKDKNGYFCDIVFKITKKGVKVIVNYESHNGGCMVDAGMGVTYDGFYKILDKKKRK